MLSQQGQHVPVRNCKLTRVLTNALLGSASIKVIICIASSVSVMNETASTLQFADRVKRAIFPLRTAEQPTSIESLRRELSKEKERRMELQLLFKADPSQPHQLREENLKLKKETQVLKKELIQLQRRLNTSQSVSPQRRQSPRKVKPILGIKDLRERTAKGSRPVSSRQTNTVGVTPRSSMSISVREEAHSQRTINDRKKRKKQYTNRISTFVENESDQQLEAIVRLRLQQISKDFSIREITHEGSKYGRFTLPLGSLNSVLLCLCV